MPVIHTGRWRGLRHECPDPSVDYELTGEPVVGDVYMCGMCADRWVWRWRKVASSGRPYRAWFPLSIWHREWWTLFRPYYDPSDELIKAQTSSLTAQQLADMADDDD